MKQFKTYVDFSLIVLLCLFATISGRGEDVHKTGASKPALAAPEGHELIGTVVEATQVFFPEILAKLETVKSFKEFFQILGGIPLNRPAANVVVTAKGMSVTKKTATDSQGKFKFTGLPSEQYEISAEMPSRFFSTGKERMARARIPFRFDGSPSCVYLELRTDLATVKGRITDSEGRPISGAKICGEPCGGDYLTRERAMGFPTRYTISGIDGSYELSDMVPPGIEDIAAYLRGLDPSNVIDIRNPFYVAVYVEADGFIQDKKNAPRVPLVAEELLGPARRYLKIMNNLDTLLKRNTGYVEKKDLLLPSSQSNTITGIDIVLKKVEDTSKQDGK